MSGSISDMHTGEGFARVEIHLFHLKPNVLSPGSWLKAATTITDDQGRFVFRTDKRGPYEVRWEDVAGRPYRCQLLDQALAGGHPMKIEVDTKARDNPPPWALKP